MRILFLSDFHFATDDKWIWDFLPEVNDSVDFLPAFSGDSFLSRRISPHRNVGNLLRSRQAIRTFSSAQYDLVVAWENKNGVPLAIWKWIYNKPEMPLVILTFSPKPYKEMWRPFMRRWLGCADHLTVPSNWESHQCQKIYNIPDDKVSTCRLGTYDLQKFPQTKSTSSYRENGAYIFTGGITSRDYLTFSKAVEKLRIGIVVNAPPQNLRGIGLPIQAIVNGIMPRRKYFETLSRAKIVIVPLEQSNHAAGLSIILHAMSAGKPVVCTNTPVTSEYVEHMKTGILVDPGDAEAMRKAINLLLSDLAWATEIGNLARLKYEREFTFSAFARRTHKILQDFHSSSQ